MSGKYERELVNILTGLGYGAMRCPSSGAGTDRDLPDVLAGEATVDEYGHTISRCMAIEHKSGRDTTLYVEAGEVDALRRFSDAFGATPYLGARFTTQASETAHYLVRPDDARRTPEGNYGLPIDDVSDRAAKIFYPNETDGDSGD